MENLDGLKPETLARMFTFYSDLELVSDSSELYSINKMRKEIYRSGVTNCGLAEWNDYCEEALSNHSPLEFLPSAS